MPRYLRQESPTAVYHFINRGVNKKVLFHKREDFGHYLKLVREYKEALDIEIYHYCLMPNHSHIVLKAVSAEILSKFAHFIQRRYAYYYGKKYKWPEQVFRKRFISIPIETDSQLLECGRYIERNAISAKLAKHIEEYPFSSYMFYARNKPNAVLTESPLFSSLGNTQQERRLVYRFYVNQIRDFEVPSPIKEELATF